MTSKRSPGGAEPPRPPGIYIAPPVIRVAPLGVVEYYPISREELYRLADGSTGSIFLNFALALLSTAATVLVTLLTTTIASVYLFAAFFSAFGLSLVLGLLFLVLWLRAHGSSRRLVEEILNRMPPQPGVQEPIPTPQGEP